MAWAPATKFEPRATYHLKKKNFAVPGPLVPAVAVCGWCKLTPELDRTPVGSHGSNWSSSMQMSQILHFQAILQIDLTWLLTFLCDLCPHEHVKATAYIISLNQVWFHLDFQLFKWGKILHFEPILQLDLCELGTWTLTVWTYKGSHIVLINQVWF